MTSLRHHNLCLFVFNMKSSILDNTNDIVVTWSTKDATNESTVEFGFSNHNLSVKVQGFATLFVDGGSKQNSQYIHRVRHLEN